jgi:D-alanyl-lipoteichoic acid acyltransferase DltB (MBOAT superfamily)
MVSGISFVCGLRIASHQNEVMRKRWLWIGCSACVIILVILKYLPFFASRTDSIFGLNGTHSSTVVTIGVSYFTFQAISYLIDIYLEIEEPEHHFGHFALYMAFFPKLLQGPIERAGDLLPQFRQPYVFNYDSMRSGMLLFAWGLFKKVAVADRLALYADKMFNNVHDYSGLALIFGTYAYALQIYFDFAGYTDMARGTGRMFGINLTENFKTPYLATSVADFWRRWHISFSRWIFDYIFKPLQMGWRNWGQTGTSLALLITFLISGIWHGTTRGFVVWGLIHGIYLVSSTYYRPYQKKLYAWLGVEQKRWIEWWQIFVTFNLVSFSWIFFRTKNLDDAWYVVSNVFNIHSNYELALKIGTRVTVVRYILLGNSKADFICIVLALCAIWLISISKIDFYCKSTLFRWFCYYLLVFSTVIMGVSGISSFMYYRF